MPQDCYYCKGAPRCQVEFRVESRNMSYVRHQPMPVCFPCLYRTQINRLMVTSAKVTSLVIDIGGEYVEIFMGNYNGILNAKMHLMNIVFGAKLEPILQKKHVNFMQNTRNDIKNTLADRVPDVIADLIASYVKIYFPPAFSIQYGWYRKI